MSDTGKLKIFAIWFNKLGLDSRLKAAVRSLLRPEPVHNRFYQVAGIYFLVGQTGFNNLIEGARNHTGGPFSKNNPPPMVMNRP